MTVSPPSELPEPPSPMPVSSVGTGSGLSVSPEVSPAPAFVLASSVPPSGVALTCDTLDGPGRMQLADLWIYWSW